MPTFLIDAIAARWWARDLIDLQCIGRERSDLRHVRSLMAKSERGRAVRLLSIELPSQTDLEKF
jgi:hypothetical protein